nr:putative late blight resistance protein homolog R1B-8 [Ipomoea batatas]
MAPVVEEDEVVGFDNEMRIIKDRLFRESMNLTVISIVGMIGVGKTTFVKMLFSDAELQYEFFTRIWVYVSRDCSRRQILYNILNIFTRTSNDDFHKMSDEDLVERIKKYLEGGKYLIVLDDVWTKEDWEQLKIVFPKNQKGSRILVTTRYQNVASHIDSTGIPHELKYLSDDECWELLEKKIFGRERCPTSLEAIGRSIAKKCDGVPLVVGKISEVLSQNRSLAYWEQIESNPFGSIEYEDDEVMREIINYDVMRDSKFKECLLYLAAFPRGSEIDARELMYLWIAEGFILGMDDELEYKAEKYVKDFVQRNLLMVVTRSADDRIKGLRIHGLLHEMYIREAAKPQNNFMREFQVEGEGAYGRGLYLHSSSSSAALALQCISKITDSSSSSSDHVRSFLSFSSQESIEEEIPEEVVAAIPNAFPNLQVLDIRDFKFPSKLPKELYRLQHLTYLGITIIDLKLLPKEFGSLTQLQTLVLHTDDTQNTSSSCVKIEADIWSCMPNLRHLLTTTSRLQLQLPSPIIRRSRFIIGRKKSSSGSGVVSKITTLSTISPTSCTPEILLKTPEIKKLGIRGNLAELMDVNQGGVSLFDNLHKLDDLENLKLINDGPQSNRLRSFPRADRFPRRLRKMTLSNTAFQWKDFSALGSLDKLEVLKLDDNAFRGESCDVRSVVFKQLQYFRIRRTDLVSWTVSKDSFPVLKCLFLIHCTKLVAVPVEFGEIESLKLLELYCTNKRAVNSAQQIHKWKYRNTKKGGFQLSVYPPDPEPIVEQNVTGFEHEERQLNDRLRASSNDRIAIPIVGLPGIGKTTLANQIFRNTEKLKTFVPTIWIHVSQSFDRKQKYIDMLCDITGRARDEYSSIAEDRLGVRIRDLLKDKKYFIVLDDIWEKKDWDSLNAVLPNNSQGSRVLVTTRSSNVVDSDEEPHILKPLEDKVSWEILEKIVFGKDGCLDNELKSLGVKIAKRCNGVPLSIVMVGGILRKSRAQAYWKHVAEYPFQEINRGDQSYHKEVRLSYDHLPHENLRNCFLYFGSFPIGQEIAALKLIRLWIAEEFIPTIDEWRYSLDLEGKAENYLKELVDRNLVMVMKISADGEIKTCRIHDSLHEFCKTEASKNDLFHIIDGEQELDENTISSHHRRLCFHSSSSFDVEDDPSYLFLNSYNKMKKKSSYPSGEHVQSLLVSSSQKSDIDLKQEELIAIPNAFPLLRVLDIESFKLSFQLPNELFSLNFLKYLAITTNVNLLPKAFKNLRELQTLVIKTTTEGTARTEGTVLEINGGIWNMEKLRHVQTKNASIQLPSLSPQQRWRQNNTKKTDIRTLSWISPTSCQKEIFSKTPHLKKLGVRGNLAELLREDEEICLFNNLQMLKYLENLKLYDQDENALKVPMLDKFAHRLRKLSFYKTFFKWDDMRILGSLVELEVLKLDENAFRGEHWDLTSDVVFNHLQYLRIGRTNLETWTIENIDSFPVLKNLVLRNCTNLEAIPSAFAQAHNLKVIELHQMSENANNSAIHVAEQRGGKENVKGLDLKITPLPPKPTVILYLQFVS